MPALTGLRLERARASKQYRDGTFHNTSGAKPVMQGSTLSLAGEFLFGGAARSPKTSLPVESPLARWAEAPPSRGLRTTWLGHSTLLLEIDGLRVLTDPVFAERVSPVSFVGKRRFHPVPATIAQLPELDCVLLSHDHYDHLCRTSVQQLARLRVPFVTSLGVGAHLERMGVEPALITELDWWEEHTLPGGRLSFTAVPAQHFSGRGIADRNETLWSSWVIRTARHRVFFSGDTGPTDEMAAVRERFAPFDLVMLEVGAWHPSWGNIHLGPENALRALEMLGGGTILPIHWGTFDLALHPWDEPAETLVRLASTSGQRVISPPLGRVVVPSELEGATPWWRGLTERSAGRAGSESQSKLVGGVAAP